MSKIILYDLPSKGRRSCWSLNPWKTRLILNFKNIDYDTVWLEYADVAPTLKSFGLPPNKQPPALFAYSIPTIKTLTEHHIMDSIPISEYLDALHPSPSLNLTSPNLPRVIDLINEIQTVTRGVWMPQVPDAYLNPPSYDFFQRTRKEMTGLSLKEYQEKNGGEEAWKKGEEPLRKLGEVLRENEGVFVEGQDVSYADFYIVSFLKFLKGIDEDHYERMVKIAPELDKLYDASQKWLERDDH